MFYSHQLLCKKSAMGHIWMAATLHAKMNRRKVEKIDIIDICQQLLNPPVPMALRLSSILMEGVVRVYQAKVSYLYSDARRFMSVLKDMSRAEIDHHPAEAKGKAKARFEDITHNEALDEVNQEIERLLADTQPGTQARDVMDLEYIIIPESSKRLKRQLFQADPETITLEDFTYPLPDWQNDLHRFGEETIPVEEENIEAMLNDIEAKRVQEAEDNANPVAEETQVGFDQFAGINEVEVDQGKDQREEPVQHLRKDKKIADNDVPPERKKRRRRVARMDYDEIVIPAAKYREWLQDTSDIVRVRRNRAKIISTKNENVSVAEKLMSLPSAAFMKSFEGNGHYTFEPIFSQQLLDIWNEPTMPKPIRRRTGKRQHNDENGGVAETGFPDLEMLQMETTRDPASTPPAAAAGDHTPELSLSPFGTGLSPDFVPSSGNRRGSERLGRRSGSKEPLQTVHENKVLETSTPILEEGPGLQEDDMANPIAMQLQDTPDMPASTQFFDLLIETEPTPPTNLTPRASAVMDASSVAVKKYLKKRLDSPGRDGGEEVESLLHLAQGLNKKQAAQLFFQTCVLATTKCVKVSQSEAYGDILIRRGPAL